MDSGWRPGFQLCPSHPGRPCPGRTRRLTTQEFSGLGFRCQGPGIRVPLLGLHYKQNGFQQFRSSFSDQGPGAFRFQKNWVVGFKIGVSDPLVSFTFMTAYLRHSSVDTTCCPGVPDDVMRSVGQASGRIAAVNPQHYTRHRANKPGSHG